MDKNQLSLTAIMTAYIRAYHAMYDTNKIFDDFLAYRFIPEDRRTLIEQGLTSSLKHSNPILYKTCPNQAKALAFVMQTMTGPSNVLSRSRYTEENLIQAIKQGVKQYVILGAGLDTFPFRNTKLLEKIHVFEVDHPATQAFKLQRITELGWKIPSNVHFIPVDFTQDNLALSLKHSSYNPQSSSFFSWLGVTMYLTRDEVFTTLHDIVSIATSGSSIIFDYLDNDAFIPEKIAARVQGMFQLAKHAGEPIKTGFDPSTLAVDLNFLGLHLRENLNPIEIEKRFFQGQSDGYYACEHVHFAWAVVK